MQWLIDIVTEAVLAQIGIPPVYIDRGDPATEDFDSGDFTIDAAWHDLDLSGIVPAGAKAVNILLSYNNISSGKHIYFRKNGNSNEQARLVFKTFTTIGTRYNFGIVACDSNRIIEYKADTPSTWTTIDFTVLGWIL